MSKMTYAVIVLAIIITVIVAVFLLVLVPTTEEELVPVPVTIISIQEVKVVFPGGFSADNVAEFPLVEMETSEGTIIGIIDVTSLEEGDEIFIIEDWKRGRSNVLHGYSWYKFAGYQQEDEINSSRNLNS